MKKFLCLLICISILLCFASCSSPVALNKDNITDYVYIDINFEMVNVSSLDSSILEQYYLYCMATITITPKGDYSFKDAIVTCDVNKTGIWTPLRTVPPKITGESLLADETSWSGKISLDKDGYGQKTIYVYGYSSTYQKQHPSRKTWTPTASAASGTVTK